MSGGGGPKNQPDTTPRPRTGDGEKASSGEIPPTPPPAGEAGDAGAEGRGAGAEVARDIAALLSEAEKQRDEYLDLAQRTKADFENYRRRMGAEVQAAALRGKAEVAAGLIDAIDNLERALGAAGLDPEGDSEDALAHGVLLVFRGLRDSLGRHGIEAVDPQGEKFDPNLHEALSIQSVEGAQPGTVVEVLQKGYRLDGQILRAARVVVSE